uniref:Uncharacterized protein n=1 Tax=Leersia perrieri TaxID=77586 RepID=A0A0D9VK25_9ORYZ
MSATALSTTDVGQPWGRFSAVAAAGDAVRLAGHHATIGSGADDTRVEAVTVTTAGGEAPDLAPLPRSSATMALPTRSTVS